MNFHSLKISEIVSETADSKTIYFDIPSSLTSLFSFLPGQYLTLKTNLNGQEIRRPYSICTMPNQSNIGVTVKKVNGGVMSTYLTERAKAGDSIDVMSPEGHFKIKADHGLARELYFFAAGSGITPIMSMIRTVLEEEPKSRCYLLYGSHDENNIIFKTALDSLVKKYEDQLILEYALSKPLEKKTGGIGGLFAKKTIDWKGYKGRLNDAMCADFMSQHAPKNAEIEYFICGPGDLISKIEQFLLQRHIDKKVIHKEYFRTIQPVDAPKSTATGEIQVTIKGKVINLQVSPGTTILDTLIAAKQDPPYSCTSGACSTCMAKVTSGTVSMDNCFALEDDEVAAGYILTCQAHPTSPNVALTFDV